MSKLWFLAAIPFLGGLALMVYQAEIAITEIVLRRMGRRAEAVVKGHLTTRSGTDPYRHPIVRWTDETGMEREHAVSAGSRRFAEGNVVGVIHNPGAPDTVALDTPERYKTAMFGLWLGVLLWAGALTAVLIRIATLLPEYRYGY
ncbi:DUF3592 domain-containing protein [Streptomyces sp. NPDC051913]|uniref:DUF3592 domain-containing protein n=1 Tax=Streptomyces sp. NPDC051913 TaxID=3365676 RepID=UPI0037D15279